MLKSIFAGVLIFTTLAARAELPDDQPMRRFKDIVTAAAGCFGSRDAEYRDRCAKTVRRMAELVYADQVVHTLAIVRPRLNPDELKLLSPALNHFRDYVTYQCTVTAVANREGDDPLEIATLCKIEKYLVGAAQFSFSEIGMIARPTRSEESELRPALRNDVVDLNRKLFECLGKADPTGACTAGTLKDANQMLATARTGLADELKQSLRAEVTSALFTHGYTAWDAYRHEFCAVAAAAAPDQSTRSSVENGCLTNLTLAWIRDAYYAPPSANAISL